MGERECVCGGCGGRFAVGRSAAPTLGPHSPVAAFLRRGAGFAELGNTSPMVAALYERASRAATTTFRGHTESGPTRARSLVGS